MTAPNETIVLHPHPRSRVAIGSKHKRTVSYDELQQLGLSKAVEEYHKLLEKGTEKITVRNDNRKSTLVSSVIKATLLHPLPWLLKPETIISIVSLILTALVYILYYITPLAIPCALWFLFAFPAPNSQSRSFSIFSFFNQQTKTKTYIDALKPHIPEDALFRAAIVVALFFLLHKAQVTVSNIAVKKFERKLKILTHADLEEYYSGYRPSHSDIDELSLVESVKALSAQYDGKSDSIVGFHEAAAWILNVGRDVGVAVNEKDVETVQGAARVLALITKAALE